MGLDPNVPSQLPKLFKFAEMSQAEREAMAQQDIDAARESGLSTGQRLGRAGMQLFGEAGGIADNLNDNS